MEKGELLKAALVIGISAIICAYLLRPREKQFEIVATEKFGVYKVDIKNNRCDFLIANPIKKDANNVDLK